jgi:hypothetical protein
MQKVDGIEAVRVSLNEGLTVLDLRPGNSVTLARLRQIIKNNGFVSKEAHVTAAGAARTQVGALQFEVSGTREVLPITASVADAGNGLFRFQSPAK